MLLIVGVLLAKMLNNNAKTDIMSKIVFYKMPIFGILDLIKQKKQKKNALSVL